MPCPNILPDDPESSQSSGGPICGLTPKIQLRSQANNHLEPLRRMKNLSTNRIKRWTLALLYMLWIAAAPVTAADAAGNEKQGISHADENGESMLDQPAKQLGAASLSRIDALQTALQELMMNRANAESVRQDVADARVLRTLNQLVSISHLSAQTFLSQAVESDDLEAQRSQIVAAIDSLPSIIGLEIARIREGVTLPRPEQTALEQAALSAEIRVQADAIDNLIEALISNNEIARELGMDTTPVEAALKQHITNRAEDTSAYLDVTMENLAKLRDQLAALPNNEELAAKIAVTQRHMLLTADVLRRLAANMESLGIDPTVVNTQLIGATGALTTDILDVGVVSRLVGNSARNMLDWISNNGVRMLFQALIVIAILLIAWKAAQLAEIVTRRALQSTRVRFSRLLQRMIISGTRSAILVLGLLIGLSQLGFSLGPLLAGLGIAGFIIGFALQDSLSNFASGLMILIYRPFDVGDLVDVNGAFGTVRQMSLVNTTILTIDNQTLVVPNNQIWQNVIKNLTAQQTRRVDMLFGISYSDDINKAERILRDIVTTNDKVLEQPEPLIKLHELGESSVNFAVRPWVNTDDYWDVYWDVTRAVKVGFDAEGISIPFPQRDVHLYNATPVAEQHQT